MKIVIIGNAEHGKSTVTEILSDVLDLEWVSSSFFCCTEFIYNELKEEFGYTSEAQCWIDRRRSPEMRERWAGLISAYNAENPTRLGTTIFKAYDIYDGIRKHSECVALRNEGKYDLAIGVDASKRLPLEGKGSMDQELMDLCDFTISNNGSLDDLRNKTTRIARALKGIKG